MPLHTLRSLVTKLEGGEERWKTLEQLCLNSSLQLQQADSFLIYGEASLLLPWRPKTSPVLVFMSNGGVSPLHDVSRSSTGARSGFNPPTTSRDCTYLWRKPLRLTWAPSYTLKSDLKEWFAAQDGRFSGFSKLPHSLPCSFGYPLPSFQIQVSVFMGSPVDPLSTSTSTSGKLARSGSKQRLLGSSPFFRASIRSNHQSRQHPQKHQDPVISLKCYTPHPVDALNDIV